MTAGDRGHHSRVALPVLVFSGRCDGSSARAVRTRLRGLQVVSGMEQQLVEDLQLCATELVTNSVRAGARLIQVHFDFAPASCRLVVADDATGLPQQRPAGLGDVRGRGLQIVADLADDWGVTSTPTGKSVWACFNI